jgi:hypothetical protein
MNELLVKMGKDFLKENLVKLPVEWQLRFKQMYARITPGSKTLKTMEETAALSIETVVDQLSPDLISLAMDQVSASLKKLEAKNVRED